MLLCLWRVHLYSQIACQPPLNEISQYINKLDFFGGLPWASGDANHAILQRILFEPSQDGTGTASGRGRMRAAQALHRDSHEKGRGNSPPFSIRISGTTSGTIRRQQGKVEHDLPRAQGHAIPMPRSSIQLEQAVTDRAHKFQTKVVKSTDA